VTVHFPIIDGHVHLVGEEVGGCYLSPRFKRGPVYRFLRRVLGATLQNPAQSSDWYVTRIQRQLDRSHGLAGVLLLPLDGRYDGRGRLDLERTAVLVPNDYCLAVCRRDPRLIPAASINPQRRDAIDELERVAEAGARCVKTVPNSQDFDPASPSYRPFYRRLAELSLPWLTHTGREHTIPVTRQEYGDPLRLVPALEEGVTVIAAHSGTAGVWSARETFQDFVALLERYPNLYGDLSALCVFGRSRYLPRILRQEALWERMVYGSDYPVPSSALLFAARLGLRRAIAIDRSEPILSRPLAITRGLGLPEALFGRMAQLLAVESLPESSQTA